MELLYVDDDLLVCIKPQGACSTEGPGGVPELARQALGDAQADIRTVHRLDQVVGGVMVLARGAASAALLSQSIREGDFQKEYVAVVHGVPAEPSGTLRDLLLRNRDARKTKVVTEPCKGAQEAVLHYQLLSQARGMSRLAIQLETGRTHQIRVQFSSRGMPLVGDRKYGLPEDDCPIALWSYSLSFPHPGTGEPLCFTCPPPEVFPWTAV